MVIIMKSSDSDMPTAAESQITSLNTTRQTQPTRADSIWPPAPGAAQPRPQLTSALRGKLMRKLRRTNSPGIFLVRIV